MIEGGGFSSLFHMWRLQPFAPAPITALDSLCTHGKLTHIDFPSPFMVLELDGETTFTRADHRSRAKMIEYRSPLRYVLAALHKRMHLAVGRLVCSAFIEGAVIDASVGA